eukprot:Lithocolla_globosa_v1_NODE_914_length_3089_cov_3.826302.p2 type:complete len:254 gc:universal NODE_914_length_3089_cov_3.826302:2291-3052(+)
MDSLVEQSFRVFKQPESEENWDLHNKELIKWKQIIENKPLNKKLVISSVRELKEAIKNCVVSRRSILSGTACELLSSLACVTKGETKAESELLLEFVPSLLHVCGCSKLTLSQKAAITIEEIIEYAKLPGLVPVLDRGLTTNKVTTDSFRAYIANFLVHLLHRVQTRELCPFVEDIDKCLRLFIVDKCEAVRLHSLELFEVFRSHFSERSEVILKDHPRLKKLISSSIVEEKAFVCVGVGETTGNKRKLNGIE